MDDKIFREKSIKRVSSPEELSCYVKVVTPGVWILLAAVILLLAGALCWCFLGRVETTVKATGSCENGTLTCYVSASAGSGVKEGMTIRAGGKEFTVATVSGSPVKAETLPDEYLLHVGGFSASDWVYVVTAETDVKNGVYDAVIVTESISPSVFLFN